MTNLSTNRSQRAKEYFLSGYNCAQSVVLAFADKTGLDKDILLKIASPFGGGMGRLREVCGCVSGMNIILGIVCGYNTNNDKDKKKQLYQRVQELAKQFEKENGSIVCRELLNLKQKSDIPVPQERTNEYYKKRPCPELVESAAEILENFLNENNL